MEPHKLKNILWHYTATGAGQTITMDNVFSKDAVGGAFYKTDNGWVCTGGMEYTANGKVIFKVWLDDTHTASITEGVKEGEKFKLLVYEDNEWKELTFNKVQLAFGRVKEWTPETFKAKAWNMMIVPDKNWITKSPTDIVPVVNPILIESTPLVILPDFVNFDQSKRYVTINTSCFWCSFVGYESKLVPANWKISKTSAGITIHKYAPLNNVPEKMYLTFKFQPFNSELSIIEKTVIINWIKNQ